MRNRQNVLIPKDFSHLSMLARTFNPHEDRGTNYTHIQTHKEGARPSVSGGVSAKTDALAGKHIAGKWRTTRRNRRSHLKGTVNQRVTAEAKASVRTPENRQKEQSGATSTNRENCRTWTRFDPCFYGFLFLSALCMTFICEKYLQ